MRHAFAKLLQSSCETLVRSQLCPLGFPRRFWSLLLRLLLSPSTSVLPISRARPAPCPFLPRVHPLPSTAVIIHGHASATFGPTPLPLTHTVMMNCVLPDAPLICSPSCVGPVACLHPTKSPLRLLRFSSTNDLRTCCSPAPSACSAKCRTN